MTPDTTSGERPSGSRDHARIGYVQVLAGAALFGINASVSKVVLEAGIEPARLAALRCTGAAVGLLVLLATTRPARLRVHWRDLPTLAVLGLTGAALIQWLYFVAIDRLPVGIALLLEFTGPLLVAVYSCVVLRQVVHRRVWLALGIALAGLALVAEVWRDAGLDPIGVAAGFGAAACLATFYLLSKHTLERRDPLSLSFWMFLFAALFWAVAQPWSSFDASVLAEQTSLLGALDAVTVPVWAALGWVVVLGTLAPYTLEVGVTPPPLAHHDRHRRHGRAGDRRSRRVDLARRGAQRRAARGRGGGAFRRGPRPARTVGSRAADTATVGGAAVAALATAARRPATPARLGRTGRGAGSAQWIEARPCMNTPLWTRNPRIRFPATMLSWPVSPRASTQASIVSCILRRPFVLMAVPAAVERRQLATSVSGRRGVSRRTRRGPRAGLLLLGLARSA